jgi:hypothetical protein
VTIVIAMPGKDAAVDGGRRIAETTGVSFAMRAG